MDGSLSGNTVTIQPAVSYFGLTGKDTVVPLTTDYVVTTANTVTAGTSNLPYIASGQFLTFSVSPQFASSTIYIQPYITCTVATNNTQFNTVIFGIYSSNIPNSTQISNGLIWAPQSMLTNGTGTATNTPTSSCSFTAPQAYFANTSTSAKTFYVCAYYNIALPASGTSTVWSNSATSTSPANGSAATHFVYYEVSN
jgi:hypothetical protein